MKKTRMVLMELTLLSFILSMQAMKRTVDEFGDENQGECCQKQVRREPSFRLSMTIEQLKTQLAYEILIYAPFNTPERVRNVIMVLLERNPKLDISVIVEVLFRVGVVVESDEEWLLDLFRLNCSKDCIEVLRTLYQTQGKEVPYFLLS